MDLGKIIDVGCGFLHRHRALSLSCASCFIYQLPEQLTKRNSTKPCRMLGNELDIKMRVQNLGHPLPQKTRVKNCLYWTFFVDFET